MSEWSDIVLAAEATMIGTIAAKVTQQQRYSLDTRGASAHQSWYQKENKINHTQLCLPIE